MAADINRRAIVQAVFRLTLRLIRDLRVFSQLWGLVEVGFSTSQLHGTVDR